MQEIQQDEIAQTMNTNIGLSKGADRGNWVRLRTIILLRWLAICGQIAALVVANEYYHFDLPYALCLAVVGISVVGNLIAIFIFPESKRLSENENLSMVMFDLLQLTLLLYLTGGLHNPFSVLILGPVLVAANVLTMRSTLLLGAVAIAAVSVLARFYLPLRTELGYTLEIPALFMFGNWVALVIAVVFLGIYSRRVSVETHAMSTALQATQMALAREQKLTDLGGVIAAAAHELGTPLATIKLTSSELIEDLSDKPELVEDAQLIREQADRCRDILRAMGRAGNDDLQLRSAPLTAVVEEAAHPHVDRGKEIIFDHGETDGQLAHQPTILRRPEIIHGLRNLIQNGVDFAAEAVWVETTWTDDTICVRISDDGPGYPHYMLGRIGDPFMRKRPTQINRQQRPEYEGMGLGLFIAKTLLERTGARLKFANAGDPFLMPSDQPDRAGAIVEVTWKRNQIDVRNADLPKTATNKPLEV